MSFFLFSIGETGYVLNRTLSLWIRSCRWLLLKMAWEYWPLSYVKVLEGTCCVAFRCKEKGKREEEVAQEREGLMSDLLQEMSVSESKHFLILFRDSGCQFRGLYSYQPDREEVVRLFGVGPRTVSPPMMDMFFKWVCCQTVHSVTLMHALTVQFFHRMRFAFYNKHFACDMLFTARKFVGSVVLVMHG